MRVAPSNGLHDAVSKRGPARQDAETLRQDIVFRFDRLEVCLLAEHGSHPDLDFPQ
jgi:hypothetical protein